MFTPPSGNKNWHNFANTMFPLLPLLGNAPKSFIPILFSFLKQPTLSLSVQLLESAVLPASEFQHSGSVCPLMDFIFSWLVNQYKNKQVQHANRATHTNCFSLATQSLTWHSYKQEKIIASVDAKQKGTKRSRAKLTLLYDYYDTCQTNDLGLLQVKLVTRCFQTSMM